MLWIVWPRPLFHSDSAPSHRLTSLRESHTRHGITAFHDMRITVLDSTKSKKKREMHNSGYRGFLSTERTCYSSEYTLLGRTLKLRLWVQFINLISFSVFSYRYPSTELGELNLSRVQVDGADWYRECVRVFGGHRRPYTWGPHKALINPLGLFNLKSEAFWRKRATRLWSNVTVIKTFVPPTELSSRDRKPRPLMSVVRGGWGTTRRGWETVWHIWITRE